MELYLPWSHTKSGSSDSPAAKGEAVSPPPQAGGGCPRITSSPVSTRMRRRPGQCHLRKVHPPVHLYSQGIRKHSYTPHKWPMGVFFKTCKTYIFFSGSNMSSLHKLEKMRQKLIRDHVFLLYPLSLEPKAMPNTWQALNE